MLIPADAIDSQNLGVYRYCDRFIPSYDTILKHPKAVLAPVTRTIKLQCSSTIAPRDIRVNWSNGTDGFGNMYPSYVLMVAFSDLAASRSGVGSGYAPAKSLFEIHMVGNLKLLEPGEVRPTYSENETEASWATSKLVYTDSKSINVEAFGKAVGVPETAYCDEKIDLRHLPLEFGLHVLRAYGRDDLALELRAHKISVKDGN